jgi:hypothetical protein
VYADLSRGTLWDWFTPTEELREGVEKINSMKIVYLQRVHNIATCFLSFLN